MSELDTATVRATYAIAKTYRQSPDPGRVKAFNAWLDQQRAEARREGQAEALRQAAYEFAEGAWRDQWSADEVECDVTAVQSTYRWFAAKADQIENGEDRHVDQ